MSWYLACEQVAKGLDPKARCPSALSIQYCFVTGIGLIGALSLLPSSIIARTVAVLLFGILLVKKFLSRYVKVPDCPPLLREAACMLDEAADIVSAGCACSSPLLRA